ncbi:MAG: tetratricopeptide repeat protein [Candidatus Aminicenantia bacterium]
MINKDKILQNASRYMKAGKIELAIEEYKKIIEDNPSDWSTLNLVGDLYIKIGKYKDGINQFIKVAEYFKAQGFYDKAIAAYNRVYKLDPSNKEVVIVLAELYEKKGLVSQARTLYIEIAEKYMVGGKTREALDLYKKVVEIDKGNIKTRTLLVELYKKEKMIDEAVDEINSIGESLLKSGKVKEALEYLYKALELKPNEQRTTKNIVEIYIKTNEYERAIETIQEYLKNSPDNVYFLKRLVDLYCEKGDIKGAEDIIFKLQRMGEHEVDLLNKVGMLLKDRGELDRAYKLFEPTIDYFVKKGSIEDGLSFLRFIWTSDSNHIPSLLKASEIYRNAEQIANLVGVLNKLYETYEQMGMIKDAVKVLKELVNLAPDNLKYKNTLARLEGKKATEEIKGTTVEEEVERSEEFINSKLAEVEVLFKNKLYLKAQEILEDLLKYNPDSVKVREKIFELFQKTGKTEKAADEAIALYELYKQKGMILEAQETLEIIDSLKTKLPKIGLEAKEGKEEIVIDLTEGLADFEVKEEPAIEKELKESIPMEEITLREEIPTLSPEEFSLEDVGLLDDIFKEEIQPSPMIIEPIIPESNNIILEGEWKASVLKDVQKITFYDLSSVAEEEAMVLEELIVSIEKKASTTSERMLEEVFREFKKGVDAQIGKEDYETRYNLGIAYKEMGLLDEAINEFLISVKSQEKSFESSVLLGNCFAEKGLYEQAISWFNKALEIKGKGPEDYIAVKYELASIHEKLQNWSEAFRLYNEIQKTDPAYRDVSQKILVLKGFS